MKTLNRYIVLFAVALGLATAAAPAFADPITSLFSTGVDANGNVITQEVLVDPHWSLVYSPPSFSGDNPFGYNVAITGGSYYNSNIWQPGIGTAGWIGPDSHVYGWQGPDNGPLNGTQGNYGYETTFDLTGFNLASVNISGLIAASDFNRDNGLQVAYLNGINVPMPVAGPDFVPFSIDQANAGGDFVAGINTLEFEVYNSGGNPLQATGMSVIFTSATATLPDGGATVTLLGGALAGLAMLRRRLVK
jgi:hypothetical protein